MTDLPVQGDRRIATAKIVALPGTIVRFPAIMRGAKRYPIWLFLLVEVIIFAFASPYFLTASNLSNVLLQGSFVGFIAVGLTVVMINGDIDLTVGSMAGLCGCLAVGLQFLGLVPALLLSLAAGFTLGGLNGVIIEKTGVNSFIVTIAGMIGIRGLVFLYTGGQPLSSDYDQFNDFGTASVGPLSLITILFLALLVSTQWMLSATIYGREAYAIGGNRIAATNAGIKVSRQIIVNFALSGLLASISGIAMAAQLSGATLCWEKATNSGRSLQS